MGKLLADRRFVLVAYYTTNRCMAYCASFCKHHYTNRCFNFLVDIFLGNTLGQRKEHCLLFISILLPSLMKKILLATMHDAYKLTVDKDYGFGAFIAGPSKTADIE